MYAAGELALNQIQTHTLGTGQLGAVGLCQLSLLLLSGSSVSSAFPKSN